MIIDAHMHLGEDRIFNTDDNEAAILQYMSENGIDGALLQPGMLTADQRQAHMRISDLIHQYPGKFWGIAVFSPHIDEDEYIANVKWAIQDLGFKAIKLHPYAFCCSPMAPQAEKIFKIANKLRVPVMIHTGAGLPNTLPSLCIPMALKYPELKIVLAHAGGGMFGQDALATALACPNVYLETSWAFIQDVNVFIQQLGCERVMFGTDLPINAGIERAKYNALHLNSEEYEWCMGKTAQKVFQI